MTVLPDHLRLPTSPVAHPDNVHVGATWRISVLDAGVVRLEQHPDGIFEDRASQMVVNRDLPPVAHEVTAAPDELTILTDRLHLRFDRGPFREGGLWVRARGGITNWHSTWKYGSPPPRNMGGTARTLDEVDGRIELGPGIVARSGIAVIDDSHSMVIAEDGTVTTRVPGGTDLYVFVFGHDVPAALDAWHALTGAQPLLPRALLGNWWSRYHPYSADEYIRLLDRFDADDLPFSVAVIDMDWHRVDDVPAELGSGWTGYSWNRELFPDPEGFLATLHDRGLLATLNLHPADGIRAHEDAYRDLAEALHVDPDSTAPIEYQPGDPDFVTAYFDHVLHPLEDEGVDFWWIDWQQGSTFGADDLDPLWLSNHWHWLDNGRGDRARPVTFSRYAGPGSHRYPVGFSGDTIITWDSLAFQHEFTATAANIGFGWWSHDVGGHMFGLRDDELATRWLQLGVVSPILRLHSGLDPFNRNEPWSFGEQAERIMGEQLRLRHMLVPYLATMMHRATRRHRSLVQPMYHRWADHDQAWEVPHQATFGTQLVVAPITSPNDPVTQLGAVTAWLPPGDWVDIHTGLAYAGDRTLTLHRALDSIPTLAPAGAIVPLVPAHRVSADTAPPEALEILVVAGGDGAFELVEDRDTDDVATTALRWRGGRLALDPVAGAADVVPSQRELTVTVLGADVAGATATVDGTAADATVDAPDDRGAVRIHLGAVPTAAAVEVVVDGAGMLAPTDVGRRCFDLLHRCQMSLPDKNRLWDAIQQDPAGTTAAELGALTDRPTVAAALAEILLAR